MFPINGLRSSFSLAIVWVAELWISVNHNVYVFFHGNKVKVLGNVKLQHDQWYLVISNHRSTIDIPIIQGVLNKKIPFLRFFLKQELIWVPFLGLAWWALDFPFMKRYSRQYLQKNPHKKGLDMLQARRACNKFKKMPTSIFNFVEGTRFSQQKKQNQGGQFKHVLKPKAGGIGYVLGAMGDQLNTLLLITLRYDPKVPGIWDYLCGRIDTVTVDLETILIPKHLKGKSYADNEVFRKELFDWSNELWHKVDSKLS